MLYKHESEISLGLSFPLTPRSGARKEMKIRFHTWRCPGIENPGEEKGATCVENCCLHSTSANVPLQGRCKRSRIAGMRFLRSSAARRQNLPAILLQDKILGTKLGSVVYINWDGNHRQDNSTLFTCYPNTNQFLILPPSHSSGELCLCHPEHPKIYFFQISGRRGTRLFYCIAALTWTTPLLELLLLAVIFLFWFYISAEEKGGGPAGFGQYFALIIIVFFNFNNLLCRTNQQWATLLCTSDLCQ